MKISVVVTVLNESKTIWSLLCGLIRQTHRPHEIIIVDAGSTDGTIQLIKVFQKKYSRFNLKLVFKSGSRGAGRNYGIKLAAHDWIAMTDAGCTPHPDWLEKLVRVAATTQAEVIAGYYDAAPKTALQAAIVPYMLVMPDKVNLDHFLPATRSMLLKKSAWQAVAGFNEDLVLSEDFDFAQRLKQARFSFTFSDKAKVTWWPTETIWDFYHTVQGMAEYDTQAGITRVKSYLVLARYAIWLSLAIVFFCSHWLLCVAFAITSIGIYSFWAVWKNFQYLSKGWYYLPLLQLVSDLGVMIGTVKGKFTR